MTNMSNTRHSSVTMGILDYPESLAEYAVSEAVFLQQHPKYDCLVTGSVVFNNDGKLLLVQDSQPGT